MQTNLWRNAIETDNNIYISIKGNNKIYEKKADKNEK